MSILIKGMRMPNDCYECGLYDQVTGVCNALNAVLRNDQLITRSACPLIEIPPHGDLIDRDALRTALLLADDCSNCAYAIVTRRDVNGHYEWTCSRHLVAGDVCTAINKASTVIGAEERR